MDQKINYTDLLSLVISSTYVGVISSPRKIFYDICTSTTSQTLCMHMYV